MLLSGKPLVDPVTIQAPIEDSQETLRLGSPGQLSSEAEAAEELPGRCVVATAKGPVEMQHPVPEPAIAEGVLQSVWAVDEHGVCHAAVVATTPWVAAAWHKPDFVSLFAIFAAHTCKAADTRMALLHRHVYYPRQVHPLLLQWISKMVRTRALT